LLDLNSCALTHLQFAPVFNGFLGLDLFQEQGVCHTLALPFPFKSILMQKEELYMETLKYLTMQKYNLQKNL